MAQALFPSMLCTSFVEVIRLLDDHAVSLDGTAVYEVAYQVCTYLVIRAVGSSENPQGVEGHSDDVVGKNIPPKVI